MSFGIPCDKCGGDRGLLMERLDPKNLRPIRRRLCKPCGRKLGYRIPDYGGPPSARNRA